MTQSVEQGLRMELAERGIELTPEQMEEVLQAAAHIAVTLGGKCVVDTCKDWGIWVELDPDDDTGFFAEIIWFDDDEIPSEEMN